MTAKGLRPILGGGVVHWRAVATLAAGCVVVVSAVWMHFRLGGRSVALDYDDVAEWIVAWLAAASCLWAWRHAEVRMRRFWAFAAVSAFMWGAGQGVWVYYKVVLGVSVPSPSLADAGFLSAVPLLVVALLLFPVSPVRSLARPVMLLDAVLVAVASLFVSWALILGPLSRAHRGGVLAQTVTLAYPVTDVILVVVVAIVAARGSRAAWVPLGFIGGGVLGWVFSDSAVFYLSRRHEYGPGLDVEIGWIVAFLLLALAPFWTQDLTVKQSAERPSRIGLLVPYVPVAAALSVAIGYLATGRKASPFLLALEIVGVVVLVLRQWLALLDSVSFGNEQVARFAALVRRSSDLSTIVSADGTIMYQSPSSLTLLGSPPEVLVDRAFQDVVHPDDAPRFLRALAQATDPGGETTYEWRLRHDDGHYVDAESRLVNLLSDPNVRGITINSRDISERKLLERELRDRALHDPLTGLANRTLLDDRIGHALAAQKRDQHNLAVAFVDLDDFKSVNDSLGHAAGDELLQEVARRLQSVVRTGDTVARLGGDEYAIVIEGTTPGADLDATTDRIIDIFSRPFTLAGNEYLAHASVGVAMSDHQTSGAAGLLQEADIAMYAAKTSGKGHRETYRRDMTRAARPPALSRPPRAP